MKIALHDFFEFVHSKWVWFEIAKDKRIVLLRVLSLVGLKHAIDVNRLEYTVYGILVSLILFWGIC